MSNLIPGKHKHLTLNDRIFIEQSLNEGKSFREIAKYLCKDPSTISDEIWKNRTANTWNRDSFTNPYNFCIHRFRCKKTNAYNKLILCDTYHRSCHICNNVCERFEREEFTNRARPVHEPRRHKGFLTKKAKSQPLNLFEHFKTEDPGAFVF